MTTAASIGQGFGSLQSPLDATAQQALVSADQLRADLATEARPGEDGAEASQRLEGYFAMMLVKEMRRSMPEGFFSGTGSDVYGAWFDEHVGAALSENDALGLAGLVKVAMARDEAASDDTLAEDRDVTALERSEPISLEPASLGAPEFEPEFLLGGAL